MSVYVDDMGCPFGRMLMYHMVVDSLLKALFQACKTHAKREKEKTT